MRENDKRPRIGLPFSCYINAQAYLFTCGTDS